MPTLNLGVVAHVDAGKTTLTERLLFEAGVTRQVGRVDHGDTVTDADALERRRGITIRSAVVAFRVGGTKINLIDTPGHSEFVAEVERALSVLDRAVLVVPAVEGVQSHTRILVRVLERLGIPFLVFVNKIDRVGAAYAPTMAALGEVLTGKPIAMNQPVAIGSDQAQVSIRVGPAFEHEILETLTRVDDHLLEHVVSSAAPLTPHDIVAAAARATIAGHVHPVLFGAALRGTGVRELLDALPTYLTTSNQFAAEGSIDDADSDDPMHAVVFKIERGAGGERIAYVRVFTGTMSARTPVTMYRRATTGRIDERVRRVTGVETFDHGSRTVNRSVRAGGIGKIVGLHDAVIGDQIGRFDPSVGGRSFADPGLEASVQPRDAADRRRLFDALTTLGAEDPLLDVRIDGADEELTVSLYGEIQKEVLGSRLAEEFGVEPVFSSTKIIHVERVVGVGEAVAQLPIGNGTVGLRIEPGPAGRGIEYRVEVERGYLLPAFHTAVEHGAVAEFQVGPSGWEVTDGVITLIQAGYCAPTPSAGELRRLAQTVARQALTAAGTTVCEPWRNFEIDIPTAAVSAVLSRLYARSATNDPPELGAARCRIVGLIPTADLYAFESELPGLTQGAGVIITEPAGYRPVRGAPPTRSRRP